MIRLLSPQNADVFKSIRLESLKHAPEAFASSFADWQALSDSEWCSRLERTPVFVAFDGTEPIGIMGLMQQTSSKTVHRASIIMVYIRESYRGTGIADALLARLSEHARSNGIRQLELMVSAENAVAIAFYRRSGFREIGRIPNGLIHEGRVLEQVIMMRTV